MSVEYGTTLSYKQLAKRVGNENKARAVAATNAANVLSLIIPCHRIIENNGKLGGYGGGLMIKQQLLDLEQGAIFSSQCMP